MTRAHTLDLQLRVRAARSISGGDGRGEFFFGDGHRCGTTEAHLAASAYRPHQQTELVVEVVSNEGGLGEKMIDLSGQAGAFIPTMGYEPSLKVVSSYFAGEVAGRKRTDLLVEQGLVHVRHVTLRRHIGPIS